MAPVNFRGHATSPIELLQLLQVELARYGILRTRSLKAIVEDGHVVHASYYTLWNAQHSAEPIPIIILGPKAVRMWAINKRRQEFMLTWTERKPVYSRYSSFHHSVQRVLLSSVMDKDHTNLTSVRDDA